MLTIRDTLRTAGTDLYTVYHVDSHGTVTAVRSQDTYGVVVLMSEGDAEILARYAASKNVNNGSVYSVKHSDGRWSFVSRVTTCYRNNHGMKEPRTFTVIDDQCLCPVMLDVYMNNGLMELAASETHARSPEVSNLVNLSDVF
jgi:hypothetical protein